MSKSLHKIDLPVLTSNDFTPWASALSKLGLTLYETNPAYAYFNSYTPIMLHITGGSVKLSISPSGSGYYDKTAVSSSSVLNKNMSLFYYRFGDSGICFNILESNAEAKTNAIIIPANTDGGSYLCTVANEIWTYAYALANNSNMSSLTPRANTLKTESNAIMGNNAALTPIHDGISFRNDIYIVDYKSNSLSAGYYLIDMNNTKYLTYNGTNCSYAIPLDLIWDDSQYT